MAQPLYAPPPAPPGGDPSYTTVRSDVVDTGPRRRIGLREAVLGILGLFAILGIVLAILGFAAAIGLDRAAEEVADDGTGTTADDVAAGFAALPAILVSLLPFLAAPVLALGCGAWAGHATRNARLGAIAGGIGGFLGPILTLVLTGMGFALGAGASGLNLGNVDVPFGISPAWADTLPYVFSGAGLLWMIANALSGALSGGLVGALMDRWLDRRVETRRERAVRRGNPRV